jgi:hypothetical protein
MRSKFEASQNSCAHRRNQTQHFTCLRVTTERFLREDQAAVEHDFELTARALDERGIDSSRLLDLRRQTGGAGKIVSLHAVGDLDLHAILHE